MLISGLVYNIIAVNLTKHNTSEATVESSFGDKKLVETKFQNF